MIPNPMALRSKTTACLPAAAVLLLAGCGQPATPPGQPATRDAGDLHKAALGIHRAASDLAWQAFSRGTTAAGWPAESAAGSAAAYLDLLKQADPALRPPAAGLSVANLSDSDPAETAFLMITDTAAGTLVIRKDGEMQVFTNPEQAADFAPPPPREPPWLP